MMGTFVVDARWCEWVYTTLSTSWARWCSIKFVIKQAAWLSCGSSRFWVNLGRASFSFWRLRRDEICCRELPWKLSPFLTTNSTVFWWPSCFDFSAGNFCFWKPFARGGQLPAVTFLLATNPYSLWKGIISYLLLEVEEAFMKSAARLTDVTGMCNDIEMATPSPNEIIYAMRVIATAAVILPFCTYAPDLRCKTAAPVRICKLRHQCIVINCRALNSMPWFYACIIAFCASHQCW